MCLESIHFSLSPQPRPCSGHSTSPQISALRKVTLLPSCFASQFSAQPERALNMQTIAYQPWFHVLTPLPYYSKDKSRALFFCSQIHFQPFSCQSQACCLCFSHPGLPSFLPYSSLIPISRTSHLLFPLPRMLFLYPLQAESSSYPQALAEMSPPQRVPP